MRRIAVLIICVMAASAATADGRIKLQKGIAGVKLGQSMAKVRGKLGKPKSVKTGTNNYGPYTQFFYTGLQVDFQDNGGATFVATTRKSEKTAGGVGPGSSRAKLIAKVKGVSCPAGDGICQVGSTARGRKVTLFELAGGKVRRVSIGVVL